MRHYSRIGHSAFLVGTIAALSACGGPSHHAAPRARNAPPALAALPAATTYKALKGVPADPSPGKLGDGTVVHPATALQVYARPGGTPVATLPSTELSGPTWVPVVGRVPGWYQVLLPSRPNHTAGWIASTGLRTARSPYAVRVNTTAHRLTLLKSGARSGTWTVAVGAAKTPTPVGRTFILASLKPSNPDPSPLVLPLGAHSDTLDSFGGGPGTVAFHGWPDKSVFGKAVTHGCVRVPPAALRALSQVPLGTEVLITK